MPDLTRAAILEEIGDLPRVGMEEEADFGTSGKPRFELLQSLQRQAPTQSRSNDRVDRLDIAAGGEKQ